MDIRKEYEGLSKRLNRFKTKPLGYEYGCVMGKVTKVKLVKIVDTRYFKGYSEAIEVIGLTTSDKEHVLMLITEDTVKGKDYKYWWKYHVLEKFSRDFPPYELYED